MTMTQEQKDMLDRFLKGFSLRSDTTEELKHSKKRYRNWEEDEEASEAFASAIQAMEVM